MKVRAIQNVAFIKKGEIYDATVNHWGNYSISIDGGSCSFSPKWFEKISKKEIKEMKNNNTIFEMPSYVTLLSEGDVTKVIFNEEKGVTVVKLNDGTKATARCSEHDVFCRETGFRVAYAKAEIKQLKKMIKDREEFIARV